MQVLTLNHAAITLNKGDEIVLMIRVTLNSKSMMIKEQSNPTEPTAAI